MTESINSESEGVSEKVNMKLYGKILALLALLVFVVASPAFGQEVQQQQPQGSQQAGSAGDPIRQLNLTPEQREQIRSIREQSKEERAGINQRVREANRALEEALDADNPDEAIVEERMHDLAGAQASAMRMRILTEVRIRRVLTLEQRNLLRTLRQQAQEFRRERLLNEPDARQRRREERSPTQNQRNGLRPLFRRRDLQRRPRL
jgi:Spy/CpxP family protein refolding chaperone